MIRNIAIILILSLLIEIPSIGATTIWSGEVELKSNVTVPKGSTLIILPGTKINCVYEYNNDRFSPDEWQIIVKGNLISSGEVTVSTTSYGLSAIKVPVGSNITTINIAAQKVDTKKIRDEFSVFRLQYLALWSMLFAGVYMAIRSR
ncbi:MAG: hypothetical protein KJ732_08090 [Candidatus Margulisbacteria bacterium]|nr:hypothetical protein [Candidatus Margulisiibacteriota bacterium]